MITVLFIISYRKSLPSQKLVRSGCSKPLVYISECSSKPKPKSKLTSIIY